ncbi:hypothetical protein V1318_15080 [Lysobacter sp. CCNWLW3]|uniref:hypothetical protein n=1 Tax=unclassified Lysobacter TaxID=2635362 RepID=UPI002FD3C1A5
MTAAVLATACTSSDKAGGSDATAAAAVASFQALDIGKAVAADQSVQPLTLFTPDDKLVASIKTQGAAKDQAIAIKLIAMANGQSVSEANRSVSPTGAATTNLEFPKNAPWPLGRYVVEATFNGKPAGRQEIEVRSDVPAPPQPAPAEQKP